MDERRDVESMFSGLPGEPPPATFTKDDVVRESRRLTLRRRNRIAAGGSAVVLALVGFGAYGLAAGPGGKSDSAAVMNSAAAPAQPGASAARPLGTGEGNFPALPPQQGGSGDGRTGPRVEGASGCEKVDWELATALAGELPGHFTAAEASQGSICTTGARGAGFPVPDGTISAAVFPRGAPVTYPAQSAGAVTSRVATGSGGTLVLVSIPGTSGQPAPYAGDLAGFAASLAPRF
ncbi:hypothetical protein VSH64_35385 [Amycolatopsis rhabdoformis]|uniref:DUF3558 domain-containing protein n=1 Tax=Amycolatopsis rhabdoformis TaxID=1448059 RepID=A0ABZ1I108_9PSEU|nr:hypothetical protein [Amycolatopsis rhabdoformis]WSE28092.1 hypothetical protein VSH64_35385 [Amycolatopsis rhabdoformis]